MKLNLNTHILDSKSYLNYLFENNQIKHVDFEKHIEQNKSRWEIVYNKILELTDCDIDMYPYFYTLDIVYDKERQAFIRFLSNYIDKPSNDCNNKAYDEYLNNIIGTSVENIALFIITMQYFFL